MGQSPERTRRALWGVHSTSVPVPQRGPRSSTLLTLPGGAEVGTASAAGLAASAVLTRGTGGGS